MLLFNKWKVILRHCYLLFFILISASVCNAVWASAYQVSNYFYSAVAIGDGGAGGAALANDASTSFSNPAGLVRISDQQFVIGSTLLDIKTKFSGSNTWSTSSPLLPPPVNIYTEMGTANGGESQIVPTLHFSTPFNNKWKLGLSAAPTYGLITSYDSESVIRYGSTKSQLEVLDISPALAYEVNEHFSLGAGIDFAHAELTYQAMAGVPSLSSPPTANDVLSDNHAKGWGYGLHGGFLYQFSPATRLGFHYRSRLTVNALGKSEVSGNSLYIATGFNDDFKTRIVLPAVSTLSAYHEFNHRWSFDGSINYTQWSNIPHNLNFYNIATPTPVDASIPWNYRNTWLIAVGGNYQIDSAFLIRAGIQYDQTPVKNHERITAVPDSNRIGASIGAHYQANKKLGIDIGWTHLFLNSANVSAPITVGAQTSTPNGSYRTYADLISGQLVWNLG